MATFEICCVKCKTPLGTVTVKDGEIPPSDDKLGNPHCSKCAPIWKSSK